MIVEIFKLSPITLLLLTVTYCVVTIINGFVLLASLKLIGKKIPLIDSLLLTGYSSIVNFFGPLQSGPGFRAVYLKAKYSVSVKSFFIATLVFYIFFAAINGVIIVSAALIRYQSAIGIISIIISCLIAGVAAGVLIKKSSRLKNAFDAIHLTNPYVWLIGLGAFGVSFATTITYYIELIHVSPSVSPLAALVYTAAANLALFVSLTPGAIGFRESFIYLTQQLHGINNETIIAASVIDRAFYVVFLLMLFIVLLIINNRKKISVIPFKSNKQ